MAPDDAPSAQQDPSAPTQYDLWAYVYDALWRRYINRTVSVAQRTASVVSGERVLDLACGTGELCRRIVEETPDVDLFGTDLSAAMIDRACSKLDGVSGVQFEQADAHDLPFEDDAFDVIICANAFHYFTHPVVVLGEVARVLHPAGRVVVLDWCRDFWSCRMMDRVLRWVDPAYEQCYTLDELGELIESASLAERHRFRYRFDLLWGMMVVVAQLANTE